MIAKRSALVAGASDDGRERVVVAPLTSLELALLSRMTPDQACERLGSTSRGLTQAQACRRLEQMGPNRVVDDTSHGWLALLWTHVANPLNALLAGLAVASFTLSDVLSGVLVLIMVALASLTALLQERRANDAAADLRAMVRTLASVRRDDGAMGTPSFQDLPVESVVPGDIVQLKAGDLVPADLRVIDARDLFINIAVLTGEAMPQERFSVAADAPAGADPLTLINLCPMGTHVVSGRALGLILRTGAATHFGQLARRVAGVKPATAFDLGIRGYVRMVLRIMAVLVPLVFVINGLTKHDWWQALMFAVAVAVGLTPEMLPTVITVNLAKGALAMAKRKVIVKRLEAIQNLGAMDVLCTDKTGTLTQDCVLLKRHLDLEGESSDRVLALAWLNSHFQAGMRNLLDLAILRHAELHQTHGLDAGYAKVDEIPFDFVRRRLSVVVMTPDGRRLLICKGAVEEVLAVCCEGESGGRRFPLTVEARDRVQREACALNEDGFRVVAVASRELDPDRVGDADIDEAALTLQGYIAFLDPPKDSARDAIASLHAQGVDIKILTGDNELVTRKVCQDVGLVPGRIVLGPEVDALGDEALRELARDVTVFAKMAPLQKERVVRQLRASGSVVGFLGDGINDGPALKAADVGVSVDTAADIARDSADIVLMEKSLLILRTGVDEGRRVFVNIDKFVRIGGSSAFGNILSVVGASMFLPFLPMAPLQVLLLNLFYDFSQLALPTDHVDADDTKAPRRWRIHDTWRFLAIMGPVSSLFDYTTFAILWQLGGDRDASLFQSGWFVESVLSQALVFHVLRTRGIPLRDSFASMPVAVGTGLLCLAAILLPASSLGRLVGLAPLPWSYWAWLAPMLGIYLLLVQQVKALPSRWS